VRQGRAHRNAIEAIDDLKVPDAGVWTVRLWLRDAAGNADPARAGQPLTLRLDQTAPDLAFREQATDDPARLRVNAVDITSGVATGAIEIRRQGEQAWRPLATDVVPGGLTAVVDDEVLPDGTYELRARAADAAGNERSTDRREGGTAATLGLPVRVKTRLAVGKVKRVKARRSRRGKRRTRTVLVVKPQTRYGRTVKLTGRLTMPGANPLVGVPVEVFERVALPGAEFQRVATISTSRTGRFVFKALRGPSRTLRFRYPGTPTIRSRTSEVDLRVRASTTIRPSRRFVVTGRVRHLPRAPEGRAGSGRGQGRRAPGVCPRALAHLRHNPSTWRRRAVVVPVSVRRHARSGHLPLQGAHPARGFLPVPRWRVPTGQRQGARPLAPERNSTGNERIFTSSGRPRSRRR
jgi:hypothetical protein